MGLDGCSHGHAAPPNRAAGGEVGVEISPVTVVTVAGASADVPPSETGPAVPETVEAVVVPTDEPLIGPPPPRRWRAPVIAAAVLVVIAVGVTVRSGGRVSGPDGAAANATSPTTSATTVAPSPSPLAPTTATTARVAATTTTMAPLGNGEGPILGEPLGLSLYVAHPSTDLEPAFLERVDLDSGQRTRIPFEHADGVRQMEIVGNELVVIGDDISAIGPTGTRLILGGQGFDRSLHDEIASMIVTDNGLTVLRMVKVRDGSAPVDLPLPTGTVKAYPVAHTSATSDLTIVFEKPGGGGGVLRKDLKGTTPQPCPLDPGATECTTGYGFLRSAARGRFQEATCLPTGGCRLMLHDLVDDHVQPVFEGPAAFDTVGVVDKIGNQMFLATAPGKSDGTSTVLRLGDGTRNVLPVALAPVANCSIEPCPAALPVWSDGGEAVFGVAAAHRAFAWDVRLKQPLQLDDLGPVTAVAVGDAHSGPYSPG